MLAFRCYLKSCRNMSRLEATTTSRPFSHLFGLTRLNQLNGRAIRQIPSTFSSEFLTRGQWS